MRPRRDAGTFAITLVIAAACSRASPSPPSSTSATSAAPASTPAPGSSIDAATGDGPLGASRAEGASIDDPTYTTPSPRGGKSLGHTSVVFKIELSNGKKSVFKPSSRRGPRRYKGEIAAYRLGLALGLSNVPRAFFRTFDAKELGAVLGEPAAELHAREVIVENGRVKGAILPWIDGLDFLPLEKDPWWSRWRAWLKRGEGVPEDQKELAADASAMVCFDWITGNWDRWSGGNVGFDKEKNRLLFVDNDGAFFDAPPKDGLERTKRLLDAIDRFPRAFVGRLRALAGGKLAAAIGDEREGAPLLSAKAIAGAEQRLAELVKTIDAKIASAGEAETLFFP